MKLTYLCSLALAALMPLFVSVATAQAQDNSQYILTPKAPDTPRINGPKVYGARPGADFLFRIPATGTRPMTFSAIGLPKGLSLDGETGIITGSVKKAGEYNVTLKASNSIGDNERNLRIVIGDKIALTPPMGWNSWNCWGNSVSQEKVMSSAKAMVDKGLVNYGWSYINIDDGWQGIRGGKFNGIQPNKKFPEMEQMVKDIHAMGLKAGIYSGPWLTTYAGHIGSSCDNEKGTYPWIEQGKVNENYKFEDPDKKLSRNDFRLHGKYSFAKQDAQQLADWGFDYLKYDWYPCDLWHLKDMSDALKATGRDIVYSFSNSGRIPLAKAFMDYAQCWRTTGDIRDEWKNMSDIGFKGQDAWAPYRKPGNWPDADMLVVGKVGWGPQTHPSKLTPDEQFTHITLWSILASPLLIGCDMAEMDDFTLSLLCNSEVIDVNQDPLGYQASKIYWDDTYATYLKPLEDGSVAVAMFNLSSEPKTIGFVCQSLGLIGDQTIRDIWRQKDIAKVGFKERWETSVAPHGVMFVRVYPGITSDRPFGDNR
ncbi:MAG: putative Ig domain-containing protein [Bacteroidales bacterium]